MDILKESRGAEYFNNLHALIGISEERWQEVLVKELLDNALDAVDHLDRKEISITYDEGLFSVSDNGGGIPEDALDNIYDFNLYVSSKRHIRMVSRGAQGNALKTVISLCFKQGIVLYFVTGGKKITYTPDAMKIGLGHLDGAFSKSTEATDQVSGVYIETGIGRSLLLEYFLPYWVVNPDVHFTINGEEFKQSVRPRNYSALHSVHWYNLDAFAELVKRTAINYPEKTTKQFVSIFSGTQRIVSRLDLPGKLLQDFYTDDQAIAELYAEMQIKISRFRPQALEKHLVGKSLAMEMYGGLFAGYRRTMATFKLNEAEIPFLVEAILITDPDDDDDVEPARNTVTTCINNSKNYDSMPFRFEYGYINIGGQKCCSTNLSGLLAESSFLSGCGYNLLIHLVTPYLKYYDKAKSVIDSEMFVRDLMHTIDPLISPVVKAIRKAQKESKSVYKQEPPRPAEKALSKKELMFEYFMEGVKSAIGEYTTTTARMVFYAVRRLVNNTHGITLDGKTDYATFTQVVCTEMFERHPELEDRVYFERRGYYIDYETGKETPLHTQTVNQFINSLNRRNQCSAHLIEASYLPSRHHLTYPYELAINGALFVEKQGYATVIKDSGILNELQLSLIPSMGFGTRAIKKMIQELIRRGITVYALTDCDIAGQIIGERLTGGSNTFRETLDVKLIGLTYADAKALGKLPEAEEYESSKSYVNILERMDEEEKDFFLKTTSSSWNGKERYTYRRIELNALTTPEFIEFIRAKIPKKNLRPTREQIREMIRFDADMMKRDAVIQHLMNQVDDHLAILSDAEISMDPDEIANAIDNALNNGRRGEEWQSVLNSIIAQRQSKIFKDLEAAIEKQAEQKKAKP